MAVQTTRMPSVSWAHFATSSPTTVLPLPVGLSTITDRASGSVDFRSTCGPENISTTLATTRFW